MAYLPQIPLPPIPPGVRKARRLFLARQRRRLRWSERRYALARLVFRLARWLARGYAGGAEKPRLAGAPLFAPIWEHPSGRVLVVQHPAAPSLAIVQMTGNAGVVRVDLTHEQAERLGHQLAEWSSWAAWRETEREPGGQP